MKTGRLRKSCLTARNSNILIALRTEVRSNGTVIYDRSLQATGWVPLLVLLTWKRTFPRYHGKMYLQTKDWPQFSDAPEILSVWCDYHVSNWLLQCDWHWWQCAESYESYFNTDRFVFYVARLRSTFAKNNRNSSLFPAATARLTK